MLEALNDPERCGAVADSEEIRRRFGKFIQANRRRLVAHAKAQRHTSPEDLAGDAWMIAWEKLDSFEGRSSLWTWVRGIATNLARNARVKKSELLTEDGVIESASEEAGVLRRLHRDEREKLLQEALAGLTERQQNVAWLRYFSGHDRTAIAEMVPGLETADDARKELQNVMRRLKKDLPRRLRARGERTSWIRSMSETL